MPKLKKSQSYSDKKEAIYKYKSTKTRIEMFVDPDLYKQFKALKTELDLNSYALLLKELLDCYGG